LNVTVAVDFDVKQSTEVGVTASTMQQILLKRLVLHIKRIGYSINEILAGHLIKTCYLSLRL